MTPAAWERLHGEVRPVLARSGTSPTGTSASGGIADEAAVDAAPFEAVTWWDPAVDAAVDPWSDSLLLGGVEVKKGSAVRLSPSHRSDAQDFFLSGLRATVAGVFQLSISAPSAVARKTASLDALIVSASAPDGASATGSVSAGGTSACAM